MSLRLHVDGPAWRHHLRQFADATPGLVPVIKGNGYGLTNARLARRAEWLGSDTVAVGTVWEVPEVAIRCASDLVVMTPWRAFSPDLDPALSRRVIHTVTSVADAQALRGRDPRARMVLELATSMSRHGMSVPELRRCRDLGAIEGVSVHLPLVGGHQGEVERVINEVIAAQLPTRTVWVSHLSAAELAALKDRWPDFVVRARVGTALWLGDRGSLSVSATVLDTHRLVRGDTFGYRQRGALKATTLLIASGGTAHGIGLEAPSGELSAKARVTTLAKGAFDAAGKVRSPYSWRSERLYFAEPPHMQASMLLLGEGLDAPAIGDELTLNVRFTATRFDEVIVS